MASVNIPSADFDAFVRGAELYISRTDLVEWLAKAGQVNRERGLDDYAQIFENIGLFLGSVRG